MAGTTEKNSANSKQRIPHSRPTLGQGEAEAVAQVIRSGHIAQGEVTQNFEKQFAQMQGMSHAAALSSGTAALHLALLALDIRPGHEVILPSFVCTALLNAVHYTGAVPVFAEIIPQTFNMDSDDVKKRITSRTRAILVPHMFGLAAEMQALCSLGIPVVEDCAQSLGSTYQGRKTGTFGTISVFSFYATKVITTGEGGMTVSREENLISRIRDLRDYDGKSDGKIRYNCKMTDMQAAMGLVQLRHLDDFISRRRNIALRYDRELACLPLVPPSRDPGHIYYRYVIRTQKDAGPLMEILNHKGIWCARPVHTPLHRCLGMKGFAGTETVWKTALSLPIYPSLADGEQELIIRELAQSLSERRTP